MMEGEGEGERGERGEREEEGGKRRKRVTVRVNESESQ